MMIPVGYMYKSVSEKPDWLDAENVEDIYSVSGCVSNEFTDWIDYWRHNGYWFFDSPEVIERLANENGFSLNGMKLFFYFAHEDEWDEYEKIWRKYSAEASFETDIALPESTNFEGFDVVTFSCGNSSECSPLSCNSLAHEIEVNSHCLITSFEKTITLIENGVFNESEPGPFRVFEVHSVNNA